MLPLTALLALTLAADPDPVEPVPEGPPPAIQVVRLDNRGNLIVRVHQNVMVPVTKAVIVVVDGKPVTQTVTAYETQIRTIESTRRASDIAVTDVAGKKLDPKEVARRLARPTAVAVTNDGKPLPAAYQRLFAPGTLVVNLPVATTVMAPAPPAPILLPPPDR